MMNLLKNIDRKKGRKMLGKASDVVFWLIVVAAALYLLRWFLVFTTYDVFRTPTGSMIPTILPGDKGYINKWKLGGRVFDFYAAAEGKPFNVRRLPGYGRLERGDVIVFNAPFIEKWDSIAMNMRLYYCKRAVAVAGDTLEIRGGFYRVRGDGRVFGNKHEQESMVRIVTDILRNTPDSVKPPRWTTVAPRDSLIQWTILEMGPLVIPGEGMAVEIDRRNFLLYRKYIEWETGSKIEWRDNSAWIGGKRIFRYTFKEDYCFAAGDHTIDSQDSRYWGLLPEKFIVGVCPFIYKSEKGMRWL
jgi:hypothetical protein